MLQGGDVRQGVGKVRPEKRVETDIRGSLPTSQCTATGLPAMRETMHMPLRLPHLTGVVLLAATSFAGAEAPLPDPVAPAVIGRPLDQIRPARPVRAKPAAAKPKQVAAGNKAVPERPSAPVVVVPAAVQQAPSSQRIAKQAVDDRADPGTHVPDDVGKGTRLASKPLAPGAYFSGKHQALVRKYYEAHPVSGRLQAGRSVNPYRPARR
jgi:hypothetical protein